MFGFLYENQDENPFKSNFSWDDGDDGDMSYGDFPFFISIISYGTSEIKPRYLIPELFFKTCSTSGGLGKPW